MRAFPQTDRVYIDAKVEAGEDKTRALVAEVRAEMSKDTSDIIKWMLGLTITSMATCISVMAFMLNNVNASISSVNANVTAELNRMNTTLNAAVKAQAVTQPGSAGAAPAQSPAPIIIQVPPYPPAPKP